MRRFVFLVMCACGGASEDVTVAQPQAQAAQPLPTVSAPADPAPPPVDPAPPPPVSYERSDTTTTVNFVEARKHPSAPRIDAVIRSAPAWRAFPNVDPMTDVDWMIQHENDMTVSHNAADAKIDAAIAKVAQPVTVPVPNVKAWRGNVNQTDIAFVRARPHVITIAPGQRLESAARDAASSQAPPAFHANEALRMRILHPGSAYPVPSDIPEARVWIDSRPADSGADIYAEADCPSPAAAAADAVAIADQIKRANNIGVRIMTAGILNNVEIAPDGSKVKMHVRATQQQIESLVSLAASRIGSP